MSDRPASFLAAARGEEVEQTPVWFMRQAGRSLPEYRALRGSGSILEAVRDVPLAIEATAQPVRRYGVDAAIIFSDIMIPLQAAGIDLEIVAGKGPVIKSPVRDRSDVERIGSFDPDAAAFVAEAIRGATKELDVPVIGFAGAPFTLASYLVEGGPSRDHARTRALLHADPSAWFTLADRLAEISLSSLVQQIEAGAEAIQLFDSWAGSLSSADYERFALPATRRILEALARFGVPRILFGVGTGEFLDLMARSGADVVGVDWRIPLDEAVRRVGKNVALQGNLDPAICLAGLEASSEAARRVLAQGRSAAGHIFNLGHGVLPETDPGVLRALVDLVHEEGRS
ncbi:MAG: uroporphyrinogen decarboxylase [Acidimicrobiales bacterium]